MKKTLSAAAIALLALTACSSTEAESQPNIEPAETEQAIEPIEEPTPEENISERGSLILEPGDEGVVIDDQGNDLVTFTVHSIEVNPDCTGQYADDPENGVFVMFDAEIESVLEAGDYYLEPGLFFNQHMYRVIDIDGVTRSESPGTNAGYSCLPESEQMPIDIGPGEKASGKVVFDVPNDGRTLMMGLDVGQDLQWEWNY